MEDVMSNTPYDDAFRTMIAKSGNLRLPFINEMFRLEKPIPLNTPIEHIHNEYFVEEGKGKQHKIITDSVLHIGGKTYHIECQTKDDGSILVRMFEYDVIIGANESEYKDYHLTVNIPTSGVLFLRKTSRTPEQMSVTINTRNGNVTYPVDVMSLADYTLDDLVEKNLLFLFPFYVFNLEKDFKGYEQEDATSREKVVNSFNELLQHVNDLYNRQELSLEHYLLITGMLQKVTDSLTQKYEHVRKELDKIMGGKILEFKGEKIFNEGYSEAQENMAEKMIRAGKLTDQEIADYTGLSVEQVEKIKEELLVTA